LKAAGLYTPTMRRLAVSFVLALATTVSIHAQNGVQAVSISFPSAQSAKPLDGRLMLLLSNNDSPEPRMQINDSAKSQIVFGMNVDGMKPGQAITVDATAI